MKLLYSTKLAYLFIAFISCHILFLPSFQYFCYVFCNLAVFKTNQQHFLLIQTFRIFATTITLFRANKFCIFTVIIDIQRTEIFQKTKKMEKEDCSLGEFCWAACFDCVAIHHFILLCSIESACRTSSFAYLRYKLSLCN